MMSVLRSSSWYNAGEGKWVLLDHSGEGVLVELEKDRCGMWQGRIPPRKQNHLLPKKSLHEIMRQAEIFVRRRDEVCR